MADVILRPFDATDIPWLVSEHRTHYARDEGFDDSFGDLVEEILVEFASNHEAGREAGWIAQQGTMRLGSIFCVSLDENTAKLRLFFLSPEARGKGLGKQLLETCMQFARDQGFRKMVLWTHESHKAACRLYAASGWLLISSVPVHSFGVDLVEQHWEITL